MNTIEPVLLKKLNDTDFVSLIKFRIKKILMICSHYDAFILEEDGQIESQIYNEYIDLNLSNPPQFVWVTGSEQAKIALQNDPEIDMVICMYNFADNEVLALADDLKKNNSEIPFVLLTHFSKEIYRRLNAQNTSAVDYIFSWHGNADLIVAIIKLFEDLKNAPNDITEVGVQAILLVEDSIRYYSTYLPELYKLILKQSGEFLKETLNEQQRKFRKRSRPKILMATNYEDAIRMYTKYRSNLLGVISDVGFTVHKDDKPEDEKLDAGIELVKHIRQDDPYMPVLLQSSQESIAAVAEELGVGFLRKWSKTLMIQMSEYIEEQFCFGDFIFRDSEKNVYGRASNLTELEKTIREIPDDVLLYNTSRNMLSKWLLSRGLFTLGSLFKSVQGSRFPTVTDLRKYVSQQIHDYHALTGRGVIAHFNEEAYGRYIWFSRMGQGSLGGKARGLAFLNSMIYKHDLASKYEGVSISIPRTIVVATDYFDKFIIENGLQYVIDSDIEDEDVLSEFVSSRLPEELVEQLKAYIATVRTPLAVRSSSKLEDSNYQPFAGVYSTYMIPYVDNKDQMLRILIKAIKSVYASVFYNGSRTYIQTTANLLSEEKMAVVVQSICGTEHSGLYYPLLSGVARSVNFYPIGNEKAEDGIVDLAFGLGKTVVDGAATLRFNPKQPKKILQLSDPKLALRDTQKKMYALDMRPGAFKISRNESINLCNLPISEELSNFSNPELVASTYSVENQRMMPGITAEGTRVITFDAILKYGKFPLAKILCDVLQLCKSELMCDVEIEFAADISNTPSGQKLVLKLLQVRPVGEYFKDKEISLEEIHGQIDRTVATASKALGSGAITGIRHIVYVSPQSFDSAHTGEMAADIAALNTRLKQNGSSYMLIGPGRWGSSDPWLGIPVAWSDISEARLIMECAIPGFQIEPSQGTHFFQNITSLGVGYLTIDTVNGDGSIDFDLLEKLPSEQIGKYVKLITLPEEAVSYIDRSSGSAIVGLRGK